MIAFTLDTYIQNMKPRTIFFLKSKFWVLLLMSHLTSPVLLCFDIMPHCSHKKKSRKIWNSCVPVHVVTGYRMR